MTSVLSSIYLIQEIRLIKVLVQKLQNLNPSIEVGIIKPYKAQEQELKKYFSQDDPNNKNIAIQTVDGFQGNEKDAIIYSSVATKPPYAFISDEKRLNVAFTRSKHILWVVGKMDCLETNKLWRSFFSYLKISMKIEL
ncbi:unnamed protein product [Blepharisma stoltei]|uniref:DNA2/NAM7 helicase-like C-terminal domain-containing protein n=1 Tax=Blepharisma stoltei TaxID=1481888 RepID=A0AAU9IP88_9CILI|nr:unnamed protein product [Blepharisma stoltei]